MTSSSPSKFDQSRADEYGRQSRIALAGYDACHELCACMLAASAISMQSARILVVGAGGTAGEIIAAARLEPSWTFLAVDPSPSMAKVARTNLTEAGLADRVEFIEGSLEEVASDSSFDAAMMIGVLHHLPGDSAKLQILAELAGRLKAGAPLVLAGNYRAYSSELLLLAAWAQRWRMNGADPDEVRAKMDRMLQGAEPPRSEEDVTMLLAEAGFEAPLRFFSSLFWGAWFTRRAPSLPE
ncbi:MULTISPECIES: class I SAM-dependent methyltransferase [Agrobacterium]|uniref:class I SAM-dependent methyltransferase n=1 Tax=Agrobacterium TaxID=357 RepID=UPI001749F1F9|nr:MULTISPECIES: class I SAM-dependent methyltransferase [Agrobacterium]MCZ7865408.1 methyltransferase domain-containing protein [Agrobacterium salinitolerans]MDA5639622.1 methyltransferase domain-containing protein [Agrobacterium sp. ST15.13.013]MDA6999483.1 methyltransferase domain-containing protein [Agrobacterium salinitolerans]